MLNTTRFLLLYKHYETTFVKVRIVEIVITASIKNLMIGFQQILFDLAMYET